MSERSFWQEQATLDDIAGVPPVDLKDCLDNILPVLQQHVKPGERIVEIGCGIGRLTYPVQKALPLNKIIGIDISPQFLKIAGANKHKPKPYFLCQDTIPNKPTGGIYSMLVFQHLTNKEKIEYFSQAYHVLRKGGVFVFQTVIGDDDSANMHDIQPQVLTDALERIGFDTTLEFKQHPEWVWVTAIK